ncbi:hypothetical protein LVJ94_35560 [Pendulispora rubella]|uniref:Uncharacterized protein n=1 Tax=Pendulispora rubella TaxID=2741070 RepID=A0ABZ2KXF7_9BACT
MADSPMHKPAGPHEKAPSAEDFDRLAALIKPSWELDDAPFSMGNRSLTPQEWDQLRGESNGEASSHNGTHGRNGVSAPAAGEIVRASVPAAGELASAPPPPRVSSPPVFPQAAPRASAPSQPAPARRSVAPEPSTSQSRGLREPQPKSDVAVAVDASVKEWQKTSLAEELEPFPAERSRKGLYVGLAAAAVVIVAVFFFATRSSEPEAPAASPGAGAGVTAPADEKAPSVSNARVDIPPPAQPQAAAVAPKDPVAAPKEPVAAPKEPLAAPKDPAVAKERERPAPKEPAQEHTAPSRPAPPRAVAPSHNTAPAAPAPSPASKPAPKGNASGGIVRDVPF